MPIVVNPSFVWPPETDPVVSPDGRITAIVDPAHAGVLLRADFDDSVADQSAQPEKVLRRNLIPNPSLATGIVPWVRLPTSHTLNSVQADGTRWNGYQGPMLEVTPAESTANGDIDAPGFAVEPGQWVAYAALVASNDNSESLLQFRWSVPGQGYKYNTVSAVASTTGTRNFGAFPVWEGATFITPRFSFRGTAGAGRKWWMTQAIAVIASSETKALAAIATYFDGGKPASGTKLYRFASDGTSEEYTPATPFIPGHGATVARVRFERQDGSVVRSGNPAWAPGGYAHAYDHEATLGGGTLWRAVPIHFDGTEGTPSEYVGAVIPGLSDGWAWLKPVNDPNKAMLLKVEPPDLSYDGRVDTTSIAGSARPAATWDVLEGFTTQLRSLVREKPVADQLMTLLDEGPVLAQFPACAGLPDFYFIRGKVDLEHVYWRDYPARRYQWDVISIDRPDTTDSPLRIPDLSYDTVERDWTTYDQLKSTVVSYNKLLEP